MTFEKWSGEPDEPNTNESKGATDPESDHKVSTPSRQQDTKLPDAWGVPYTPEDKDVNRGDRRLAKSVEEAELQRLGQSNKLRPWSMGVSLLLAAALVFTSCAVALTLASQGKMTDAIGVGFMVSLSVETIGVVAIIAHYLFATPDSKFLENNHKTEE